MEKDQPALDQFEIVKFGPYRFIGKSVYASNARGTGEICDFLWAQGDWIFKELDALKEYASDEVRNAALTHWEIYNPEGMTLWEKEIYYGKTELLGYTVGRFMKANTPVPEGMNYIDIFDMYIAKALIRSDDKFGAVNDDLVFDEIRRTGLYEEASYMFKADFCPAPGENGAVHAVYMACILKNPPQA